MNAPLPTPTRIRHDVAQGSAEWLRLRAAHFCASDAPAMMGVSPYETRNDLLKRLAFGIAPEVDAETQRRFDKGHEIEEFARNRVQAEIFEELSPAVFTCEIDGLPLLSSLDGITEDGGTILEVKTANAENRAAVVRSQVPEANIWQVTHQLLVSGASECIFAVSDGADVLTCREGNVPWKTKQLLDGWKQFALDLEALKRNPPAPEAPPVIAQENPILLPALSVKVEGRISVQTDLDKFGTRMREYIASLNLEPETEQDFEDLAVAAKELVKAEEALEQADKRITEAASIGEVRQQIEALTEIARRARLAVQKLCKSGKDEKKAALVANVSAAWTVWCDEQKRRIPDKSVSLAVSPPQPDLLGAVKGLKTLESYCNALDTCIAQAKIKATEFFQTVSDNLLAVPGEHRTLFPDLATIATKGREDFANLVQSRIAAHQQAQAEKEAARKAAEEAMHKAAAVVPTPAPTPVAAPAATPAPTLVADTLSDRRLKLGDINTLLAPLSITATGLEQIGFAPAGKEKSALLYRESDYPRIVAILTQRMQESLSKLN